MGIAGVTSVRKFMFDHDFDAETGAEAPSAARPAAKAKPTVKEPSVPAEPAPPPPPPAPTFSEAELKAATDKARAEGQKAGEAKGRNAAKAEIEQRAATALQSIADDVVALQRRFAADRQAILSDASALALAILKKVLPEFSRRGGLAEIEALLARGLLEQRREPRLVARVSPDLAPELEPRINALSADAGFEGRLYIIADDRLGVTDCTLEWADGGMERHADAIWAEVSAALERCLTLQGIEMPRDLATPAAAAKTDIREEGAGPEETVRPEEIPGEENAAGPAEIGAVDAMRSE